VMHTLWSAHRGWNRNRVPVWVTWEPLPGDAYREWSVWGAQLLPTPVAVSSGDRHVLVESHLATFSPWWGWVGWVTLVGGV